MSDLWFYAYSEDSEHWDGPWESQEAAAREGFDEDADAEVVFVNTGVWLDPATLICSEDIFERLDDSAENCPIDEEWQSWWGLKSADMAELDARLAATFREWADERSLRRYYQVGHDGTAPAKVKRSALSSPPKEAP